jgi:glycosyltransferase involved in cell wall biosynthesis
MARILHIIPGLTGGGAERQLTILAAMQAERGHQVHIALLRPDIPEQLIGTSVQLHHVRVTNHYDLRLLWRLLAIARSIGPDIVQTWLTLPDIAGGLIARMLRKPWVLSERSEAAAYPPSWKNRSRVRLARHCNAVVANSTGGAEYWRAQGVPPARIVVVPNAVSVPDNATPPVGLPAELGNRPMVLFAGRLDAAKNPLVMIDALSLALSQHEGMALLCGTGPMEPDITARIQARGMQDRIILAGHRSDVPSLMRHARVCVAVSVFEGNPNVVLEAMAVGCPLVVSDIPAYTQLLDATTAMIVPRHDVTAIASAIAAVLHNPDAAAHRATLAKVRVAHRTPSALAQAYDNVYAQFG